MEVLLERAQKSGDILVAIRFDREQKNFNADELKWWPRLDEIDMILDARKKIMETQSRKKTVEIEPEDIPFADSGCN